MATLKLVNPKPPQPIKISTSHATTLTLDQAYELLRPQLANMMGVDASSIDFAWNGRARKFEVSAGLVRELGATGLEASEPACVDASKLKVQTLPKLYSLKLDEDCRVDDDLWRECGYPRPIVGQPIELADREGEPVGVGATVVEIEYDGDLWVMLDGRKRRITNWDKYADDESYELREIAEIRWS